MNLPFFSIVVPLYNKEKYIRCTVESILSQTFQDFEIIVINDGSTDKSVKVVESMTDDRIRLINQENAGVSAARNKGVQNSKSKYVAFLDADDIWFQNFLRTIYELICDYPDAGLYATAYKKRNANYQEFEINIQGLPSKNISCIVPNYFKSIVEGDLLVWTSATCIPKKIFTENDIEFPVGEKYGEDQYVWARIAMQFEIAYNKKKCSIYQIEAENNTTKAILNEKEPHKSILMLRKYRNNIKNKKKLKYFDIYIEKHVMSFILRNIINNKKIEALKQLFSYQMSIAMKIKLLIMIFMPSFIYTYIKKTKNFYH